MDQSWQGQLSQEFEKPYMKGLKEFLLGEANQVVYPPTHLIFNALRQTPFSKVKVVIMGQDPYHGPGQAEGMSFSVPKGVAIPPSLLNIYKELEDDLGIKRADHGHLLAWAKQGVLLLNATLTVRQGQPKSHFGKGWELFTDQIIRALCERKDPLVFMLWGRSAFDKVQNIFKQSDAKHHLILTAAHPSPLSAYNGFFGCKHFSKANEFLKKHNKKEINWDINAEASG